MCTVHGAALTVGKIKQYKGGSPPSAGQMTAQKEKACGAAPTCNELSSCTLPSPSPRETLQDLELREDSEQRLQAVHKATAAVPPPRQLFLICF